MVTFSPPVASWSFLQGHTLDELWAELHQASAALLQDHLAEPFDEAMQKKLRVRILAVVLFWAGKGWVSFDAPPALILDSPETSTGS